MRVEAFLKLKNASSYTRHCFGRTSAFMLADSGTTVDLLTRHGAWRFWLRDLVDPLFQEICQRQIFGQATNVPSFQSHSLLRHPARISAVSSEEFNHISMEIKCPLSVEHCIYSRKAS